MPANLPVGLGAIATNSLKDLDRLKAVPSVVATNIREMQEALKGTGTQAQINSQIIAVMGSDIEQAAKVSRDFNIPLDANTRILVRQAEAAKASAQRAEDWRRAWSTAIGNITSQFASGVVDTLLPDRQAAANERESLERQITDIQRTNERARLQAAIDGTRQTSVARKTATMELAAFEKRVRQEEDAARNQQLAKLQSQLENQTNLFRKFASRAKGIFTDLAKSILKIFVTDLFTSIGKAISDSALGTLGRSAISKLGGLIPGIGGTAATTAAGTAIKAGGSAAGGIASSVGGAASGLAGGLVSGGLAFAGSIVASFMSRGREQRTEENTRETRDWLELQTTRWDPLLNQMVFYQASIDKNFAALTGPTKMNMASVTNVTNAQSGAPIVVEVTNANSMSITVENAGMSDMDIREMAAKLLEGWDLGTRGQGEKLAQIVAKRLKGLTGTEVAIGI